MSENKNIFGKAIFAGVAILLFWLGLVLFKSCEHKPDPSKVDSLIEQKSNKVDSLESLVLDLRDKLKPLSDEIKTDNETLIKYKILRDTVRIIQIQDSIIYKQGEIIYKQDTIIQIQSLEVKELKEINLLKDVKIESLESDNKSQKKQSNKYKRQRNFSIIGGVVATIGTVLILTK